MVSLNAAARGALIYPLFLSAAQRTKLKSPRRIHEPKIKGGSSRSCYKNGREPAWSEGPYMLVTVKSRYEALQVSAIVSV
jgi:hypothetical protein